MPFDEMEVAELAEGGKRELNIQYIVQNVTNNIKRSNIGTIGGGSESQDSNARASESTRAEKPAGNQAMIGEENPEDVTWLTPKLLLFNKLPISRQRNSNVYHGRQELMYGHDRDVAIKLIQYSDKNKREVQILMKLNHANIVQIYEAGEHRGIEHRLYIVMELCSMNLEEYVRDNPANPEKALQFLKQIAAAVDFMHKRNIAHRDIKPPNILISKCGDFIKVSDFGISKEIPDSLTSVTTTSYGAGTEGYKAPEIYDPNYKVTLRSDIFSLGLVTAYLLSHGKHPFGEDPWDWSHNIRNNKAFDLSQIPTAILKRQQLVDLIERMLQHAPSGRPMAQEISKEVSETLSGGVDDTNIVEEKRMIVEVDTFEGSNARTRESTPSKKPTGNQAMIGEENRPEYSGDDEIVDNVPKKNVAETSKAITPSDIERDRSRKPMIAIFDNKSKQLHRFNPVNKTMTKMHKLPVHDYLDSYFQDSVTLGEYIYVIFRNGSNFSRSHQYFLYRLEYCNVMATWETISLPDWFDDVGYPRFAASSDAIILVGYRSVSKYEPSSRDWKRLPDSPEDWYQSVVYSNGFLYCIGCRWLRSSKRVDRLDLKTMEWKRIADMKAERYSVAATEYKGNIYVAGDFDEDATHIEKYDPEVDQWTILKTTQRPTGYSIVSILTINEDLYLVCNDGQIQKYDLKKNELSIVASYPGMKFQGAVLVKISK